MQKTRQIDQKLGVVDTFQNNREYIRKTQKKSKKRPKSKSNTVIFFKTERNILTNTKRTLQSKNINKSKKNVAVKKLFWVNLCHFGP